MFSLALLALAEFAPQEPPPGVRTFLNTHCIDCHGGDATKGDLDLSRPDADAVAQLWRWSRVRDRVLAGEMPPPDSERPPMGEQREFTQWIDRMLPTEVAALPPDAGKVTVRRLSRSQWQNAVRDLFGVAFDAAAFPADDLGHGFDTVGEALTFSTLHLEHYLAAAGAVVAQVVDSNDPAQPTVREVAAQTMSGLDDARVRPSAAGVVFLSRATLTQAFALPRAGRYLIRVHAAADQAGDELARLALQVDSETVATFTVPGSAAETFAVTTTLAGGERRLAITFLNDHYEPNHPDPRQRDRNLHLQWLEVTGPLDVLPVPPAAQWLADAMAGEDPAAERLQRVVHTALPRIWRRPATAPEMQRMLALGERSLAAGESLALATRLVLQAALASPHFLFRIEMPSAPSNLGTQPLPGHVLAQRLAFFLWGSTPDERLRDRAAKGRLGDRSQLLAEVDRMLADARAESLATDFAAQWFELRSLAEIVPDPQRFPSFDDELRRSLRRQTELLFATVLREDRDVRELIDCDFTFVDRRSALFYELPFDAAAARTADGFVRTSLPIERRSRGGVLGHASVLAVTSGPTRTSPVKRGKWILENLLGQAPPPPPPGSDSFADEAAIDSSKSFRDQLAQHRDRRSCAVCHVRMDALGFALENFDATGRHRERDAGGPIDASGELPDGRHIAGLADLQAVLRADPAFVRTVTHKLFVYALGRALRPIDRLRLDGAIAELLRGGKVTLRDLLRVVVADVAFTHRSGGL